MDRLNLIICGGSARMAAHVGALRPLRQRYNIQRTFAVSAGAVPAAALAADVDQPTLEERIRKLDMRTLLDASKRSLRALLRGDGRFSLDGVIGELRDGLARSGKGGDGVRTFGDLPSLDPSYASAVGEASAWRLSVRVWTDPAAGSGFAASVQTLIALAWADRFLGEARGHEDIARVGGVFARMRTLHLPEDLVWASRSVGHSIEWAVRQASELPVAEIAALTMALPGTFVAGSLPAPLAGRAFDGAMLERVPARRFPAGPARASEYGTNDIYRLADGRPDRTPTIALAMEQSNGLTPRDQRRWDLECKTARHGIFVVRLPSLGVRLTDFEAGHRRAPELIEAAEAATKRALASESFERYLAGRGQIT